MGSTQSTWGLIKLIERHIRCHTMKFLILIIVLAHVAAGAHINQDQASAYLRNSDHTSDKTGGDADMGRDEIVREALEQSQIFNGLRNPKEVDKETDKVMNAPRCENNDIVNHLQREKRSLGSTETPFRFPRLPPDFVSLPPLPFHLKEGIWPKKHLTYKMTKYGTKLGKSTVDKVLKEAFNKWAEVSGLSFSLARNNRPDIDLSFVELEHGDGYPFSGHPLGAWAHASAPEDGKIHFDDSKPWDSIRFMRFAVHEIGHSLGLDHVSNEESVMYQTPFRTALHANDIGEIQRLYGKN